MPVPDKGGDASGHHLRPDPFKPALTYCLGNQEGMIEPQLGCPSPVCGQLGFFINKPRFAEESHVPFETEPEPSLQFFETGCERAEPPQKFSEIPLASLKACQKMCTILTRHAGEYVLPLSNFLAGLIPVFRIHLQGAKLPDRDGCKKGLQPLHCKRLRKFYPVVQNGFDLMDVHLFEGDPSFSHLQYSLEIVRSTDQPSPLLISMKNDINHSILVEDGSPRTQQLPVGLIEPFHAHIPRGTLCSALELRSFLHEFQHLVGIVDIAFPS